MKPCSFIASVLVCLVASFTFKAVIMEEIKPVFCIPAIALFMIGSRGLYESLD